MHSNQIYTLATNFWNIEHRTVFYCLQTYILSRNFPQKCTELPVFTGNLTILKNFFLEVLKLLRFQDINVFFLKIDKIQ